MATETPEKAAAKTTGMEQKIQELAAKRAEVMLGGGEDKIEKQHEAGKLTARERIDAPGRCRKLPGDRAVRASTAPRYFGMAGKRFPPMAW